MIKIILLGAGNVGHHLSKVFNESKQIDLVQWYCRDKNKIALSSLDTEIIDDLANIKSADIYIISISDSYVGNLSKELNISDKLVVHTSGSLNFTILDNKNRRFRFCNNGTNIKLQIGSIKPTPLELWLCELIDFATDDPHKVYLSALHCGLFTMF